MLDAAYEAWRADISRQVSVLVTESSTPYDAQRTCPRRAARLWREPSTAARSTSPRQSSIGRRRVITRRNDRTIRTSQAAG